MPKKITSVSIEEDLIELAKLRGLNVSALVEDSLRVFLGTTGEDYNSAMLDAIDTKIAAVRDEAEQKVRMLHESKKKYKEFLDGISAERQQKEAYLFLGDCLDFYRETESEFQGVLEYAQKHSYATRHSDWESIFRAQWKVWQEKEVVTVTRNEPDNKRTV